VHEPLEDRRLLSVGLDSTTCELTLPVAGFVGPQWLDLTPPGSDEDYEVRIGQGQGEDEEYDFGDAPQEPDVPGYSYPTLMPDGARHLIVSDFCLGGAVDAEPDGQPDPNALGDDQNLGYPGIAWPPGDEDGVTVGPLVPGQMATFEVTVTDPGELNGYIDAWIDADQDGSFTTHQLEKIIWSEGVIDGPREFDVPISILTADGDTYVRFRLSTELDMGPDGPATAGEVEDYAVYVEPRDGLKWLQRPDYTSTGIDVRFDDTDGPRVVADDFECTEPGLLTSLHFWGSWRWDDAQGINNIHVEIHSDDPIGQGGSDPDNEFSKPDERLWFGDFGPDDFHLLHARIVEEREWFWDPVLGVLEPGADADIWEYAIDIDPAEAFEQTGTTANPVVYWVSMSVDVELEPGHEQSQFGWKTRQWPDHFNDDAVYRDEQGQWQELKYPTDHPYAQNSIDMAFALTTEVPSQVVDVLVASTQWHADFKGEIINLSLGDSDGFYRIPVGDGHQLYPLPWSKIDQIRVVFSEDVNVDTVDLADMVLTGVNNPQVWPDSVAETPGAGGTEVVTWTFEDLSIQNDKLYINLDESIDSATTGLALDGDWDNPTDRNDPVSDTYPSGDGVAGADFNFRFNILVADANQSERVSGPDLLILRGAYNSTPPGPPYTVFADFDGSGRISGSDLLELRSMYNVGLVGGNPLPYPFPPGPIVGAAESLSWDLAYAADLLAASSRIQRSDDRISIVHRLDDVAPASRLKPLPAHVLATDAAFKEHGRGGRVEAGNVLQDGDWLTGLAHDRTAHQITTPEGWEVPLRLL